MSVGRLLELMREQNDLLGEVEQRVSKLEQAEPAIRLTAEDQLEIKIGGYTVRVIVEEMP